MSAPKHYECPLCGKITTEGSRVHWSKFHENEMNYEHFMAKCLDTEVPKCQFCGSDVYWDSKHSRFAKVCCSNECKKELIRYNGRQKAAKLVEYCKENGKGLWDPKTLEKSHEVQRATKAGFWNKEIQAELSRRSNISQIGKPNAFKRYNGNESGRIYIAKIYDRSYLSVLM